MPSKYVLKTICKVRLASDRLERAARKVFEEGMSYRSAASNFGVDKMTLMRYIKKKQINPTCALGYAALSLQMIIFSPETEKELTKHIVFMADMYFGLSPEKCKELAFEFAMRNNQPIPQSWKDNRKAGIQWWISFNDDITYRSENQYLHRLVELLLSINTQCLSILQTWELRKTKINLE